MTTIPRTSQNLTVHCQVAITTAPEADRVNHCISQILTTLDTEQQRYSLSFLSERLRTGLPSDEIHDTLDPNAEIPESTITLLNAIPSAYYSSLIATLAERLLDVWSDAVEGGLAWGL